MGDAGISGLIHIGDNIVAQVGLGQTVGGAVFIEMVEQN